MASSKTVAEIVAGALVRHGVETLFSQSLPSAVLLAIEDRGLRQFTYRTENAGAAMADGYARLSGKVGVVTAQNGPAATLLVPGLAEALKSSIPLVALVQDVNRKETDRNAFQELDHLLLFQACAKWVRRVTEPSRVEDYLDMAFTAAASGRPGPAVLMLPADLLLESHEPNGQRTSSLGRFPLDRTAPDAARIAEAAGLINAASNPLIVAGGGVHVSGATGALAAIQDAAGIPVVTTVMGKGAVDERHPLSMGVGGNLAGRLAAGHYLKDMVAGADVVVLVGTRTAQNGTDSWTAYGPSARFIHIDIDPGEIGRNYDALRLAGDARLILETLGAHLKPSPARARAEAAIAKAREAHARDLAPVIAAGAPIRPERMMKDIQEVLTPETVVVADASYATVWLSAYLRSLSPGMRFITPRGLAGLGWGLPLAMGARHAEPERPVICIVGDGGFAHVWAELETSVRTGTPIVLIVLNNGILGFQKDAETVKFGRHTDACFFSPVDHAALGRACGCEGVTVTDPAAFLPALKAALGANTTTVLDVMVDETAYPPITAFDELPAARARLAARKQQ